MDFSAALHLLKDGKQLARAGWNGADQFIYQVPGSTFLVNRPPLLGIYEEGTRIDYLPHLDIKNAQGACVPWLASQGDLLAEDWYVVTESQSAGSLHDQYHGLMRDLEATQPPSDEDRRPGESMNGHADRLTYADSLVPGAAERINKAVDDLLTNGRDLGSKSPSDDLQPWQQEVTERLSEGGTYSVRPDHRGKSLHKDYWLDRQEKDPRPVYYGWDYSLDGMESTVLGRMNPDGSIDVTEYSVTESPSDEEPCYCAACYDPSDAADYFMLAKEVSREELAGMYPDTSPNPLNDLNEAFRKALRHAEEWEQDIVDKYVDELSDLFVATQDRIFEGLKRVRADRGDFFIKPWWN